MGGKREEMVAGIDRRAFVVVDLGMAKLELMTKT